MKAVRICMIICAALFLLGLVGSIQLFMPSDTSTVEILQNGKTLYTFDLSQQTDQQRIEIRCEEGVNIIYIGPEGICMESADCADQTCVEMGYLKSSALPIVCLPHELTIRYVDSATTENNGVSE